MIANLWDSLSPRQRIIRFRLSISSMWDHSWIQLMETDRDMLLHVGHTLGMDYIRQPDPCAFSGPTIAKVETHH